METKKISAGQFMLLLLLARLMHTVVFRTETFEAEAPVMIGLLLSTAVELVISLPVVIWLSKGGRDISQDLGGWIKWLYAGYFIVIAASAISLFTNFFEDGFENIVPPITAIVIIFAASAYCAAQGIEGLGRAGTVVFWIFTIMFLLMAVVNEGKPDFLNLAPPTKQDINPIIEYFIESLSSSWWLPLTVILGVHLRSGIKRVAYGYLALKFGIIELLMVLLNLILWKYVDVLSYPIFALGAYAKTDFIQRFDAINMMVWAINCVLVGGVYLFVASKPLESRGKNRTAILTVAVAAIILCAYEYKSGLRFDETWFLIFKLTGIAVLGVIVPLVAIIKRKVFGDN